MTWSEGMIARALAVRFFNGKYLCVVPNCNFTGYECDMLCVTENMRLIDVEIKISRSDLKADAKKDKWWRRTEFWRAFGKHDIHRKCEPVPLEWPRKVWKHYYALPAEIWSDELLECLPSPMSGVLLLHKDGRGVNVNCLRMAKPCKDADRLTPEAAVNVARLASLRMWDQFAVADNARKDAAHWREQYNALKDIQQPTEVSV